MEKKENSKKKKLPLAVRLLLLPFKLVTVILVFFILWCVFCKIDRTKAIDALPPEYALYLRTDKIWDTAEPLIDLDATLIALTSPELQQYREPFLQFKKSKLRQNLFIKFALKRRLDAAVYQKNAQEGTDFIAILDAGFLSGLTRLTPFVLPHIKKLSTLIEVFHNDYGNFYKLQDNGYFVIHKNLVVFTSNLELMQKVMSFKNSNLYLGKELNAMTAKLNEPLRILADSKNLMNLLVEEDASYIQTIISSLSKSDYSSVNFGISSTELNVTINLPLEFSEGSNDNAVIKLLKKNSKVPVLLPKFTDDVQYYSLINAGFLSELKAAAQTALSADKNFIETWNKADVAVRMLFNRNLDDILFSWTSDEFAVFGIEGKAEPVLAIKVSSESVRKEIFNTIFSSFVVMENDSLLVDGVRLPCIELPSFLLNLLKTLDINVPKPYYLVKDDFIYFSKSPENLISISSSIGKNKRLSGSENWKRVSSKQSPYSTLSLYYNLERSIPFFIKGNTTVSKILSLYNSGRFDLRIKDDNLSIQLQASSLQPESSRNIPGYPISLEKKSNAVLVKSNAKKSSSVFWTEKDSTINSLNCSTFEKTKKEFAEIEYIAAASEECIKATGGELWGITNSGLVYLLTANLETVENFPILTGAAPACAPFNYKDMLGFADTEGALYFISASSDIKTIQTGAETAIKSTPCVYSDYIAFYEKAFFGGIHLYKNLELKTPQGPLELDGIAYGSPCLFTCFGKQYVAMITQAGRLYVYGIDGKLSQNFPLDIDNIFYINVKFTDNFIFALAADGELYRISMKREVTKVKIPYFTAKSGYITTFNLDSKDGDEIFICGEGNTLYGFKSNLEMLPSFPVPGYGNPVFIDLNGDNKKDCLTITFDNTISAANVLK